VQDKNATASCCVRNVKDTVDKSLSPTVQGLQGLWLTFTDSTAYYAIMSVSI